MPNIQIDVDSFKTAFPVFSKVPGPTIELYFGFATDIMTNEPQCGVSTQIQTRWLYLMTAHLLAINLQVLAGNNPGIVTQASIDKISVTMQPPPERNQWQWWLNQTPYGQQLLALLQAQSAGGFYVGGTPERTAFRGFGGRFY